MRRAERKERLRGSRMRAGGNPFMVGAGAGAEVRVGAGCRWTSSFRKVVTFIVDQRRNISSSARMFLEVVTRF